MEKDRTRHNGKSNILKLYYDEIYSKPPEEKIFLEIGYNPIIHTQEYIAKCPRKEMRIILK